jgi:hypothetical protein
MGKHRADPDQIESAWLLESADILGGYPSIRAESLPHELQVFLARVASRNLRIRESRSQPARNTTGATTKIKDRFWRVDACKYERSLNNIKCLLAHSKIMLMPASSQHAIRFGNFFDNIHLVIQRGYDFG